MKGAIRRSKDFERRIRMLKFRESFRINVVGVAISLKAHDIL